MDIVFNMWAIFGFIAFIATCSLQGKVSKLERQLREMESSNIEYCSNLQESLKNRIGCRVKFRFYDEEHDMDLLFVDAKKGYIEIVDVDDKWVQVHCETKNKKIDKLIRISSISGIEEIIGAE